MLEFLKATICSIVLITLIASCAGIPEDPHPELYWPFPPEKPRVKFLNLIIGSLDVEDTKGRLTWFKRLVFGYEHEVEFRKPMFVTVRDDVLYVTDISVIHVYDFKRKKFRLIGRGVLNNATGIAVSPDGKIFVGDTGAKKVFVISPDGKIGAMLGGADIFHAPGGIAIDDTNQRVIIADAKKHNVTVWGLVSGKLLFTIGKRGTAPGEFNFPYSVAVDSEGKIYVMDSGNFRVQIFDRDGNFLNAFGGIGDVAGVFARPKGIALDSERHIYVVDTAFGNFQIFDNEGRVYLVVGSTGTDSGKFVLPAGIFIDKNDKIYVADQMNRRVQVFQFMGSK